MPNQEPSKPGAGTWREIRAEAVKAGRLNEAGLEAHKRRMLAAERCARAEHQQDDKDSDS